MTTLTQISRLRKQVEALESRVKSQPRRRRLSDHERIEMLNEIKQDMIERGRPQHVIDRVTLEKIPEYEIIPSLEEQQRFEKARQECAPILARIEKSLSESRRIREEQDVHFCHADKCLPEPTTTVNTAPEVEESLDDFELWLGGVQDED